MKVLQLCSYYLGSDLYEKMYTHLELKLEQNQVYVPHHKNTYISKNVKYVEKENLILSECYQSFDRVFFFHKENKIFQDMCRKVSFSEIDMCHAHSLFTNGYLAYKLNKKYGFPYIVAVRNTDVNVFFKRFFWLRKIGIKILCNAEKIIFISPAYKDMVIEQYIPLLYRNEIFNKSIVVPNGVDDFWLQNGTQCKQFDVKKREINIVYVGVIDKNKNIETTIKACKELIERGYKVRYGIIGGAKNEKILAKALQNDFVTYYGRKTKEEIGEIMKQYEIFVMPSFHETFGLVYVEAISQGLPVIYTKNQGFDGWFSEGIVGYAVKADDWNDISNKIEKIVNNYNKISDNCREKSKKFNWSLLANEYFGVYQNVLKEK